MKVKCDHQATELNIDRLAQEQGATHRDTLTDGRYWYKDRVTSRVYVGELDGHIIDWQPDWHSYIPEWCSSL